MIEVTLQVHYCCYGMVIAEISQQISIDKLNIQFMGNARHHHRECPKKAIPVENIVESRLKF